MIRTAWLPLALVCLPRAGCVGSGAAPDAEGKDHAAISASAIKPAEGGCASGAETMFSCRLSDGKPLAVCVAGAASGKPAVALRWGHPGAQTVLPAKGSAPPRFARVGYSGGGEMQIAFASGDMRHIVFSRTVRTNFTDGHHNAKLEDGLLLLQNDKPVRRYDCDDAPNSSTSSATDNLLDWEDELLTDALQQ